MSILLAGTDDLLRVLREPSLAPLRTRFAYAHSLRAFGLDDARNYVRFHLAHAGGADKLFIDAALTGLFLASQGVPRQINQLALQALVEAVVRGLDQVEAPLMKRVLQAHRIQSPKGPGREAMTG